MRCSTILIFVIRRRFVMKMFCYKDVLFWRCCVICRRRYVTETFCSGDVLYGVILPSRRLVWRGFECASHIQNVSLTNISLAKGLFFKLSKHKKSYYRNIFIKISPLPKDLLIKHLLNPYRLGLVQQSKLCNGLQTCCKINSK
jgi:hypothetical protein